jgi:hypothetical protein
MRMQLLGCSALLIGEGVINLLSAGFYSAGRADFG